MSTDWREKEREFLSSLAADTGRDLGQWMALITAQKLPHRNDIIDWLRQQGFLFARASWLERIHNNGGRPIYTTIEELSTAKPADVVPLPRAATSGTMPGATVATKPAPMPPANNADAPMEPPERQPGLRPAPQSAPTRPMLSAASADEIADVLAKAKAFRPLAQHLLKSVESAVPGLVVATGPGHLAFGAPRAFGLLAISGKDLRLALDLGNRSVEPPFEAAKLPVTLARPAAGMQHMLVLTDARQIDGRLVAVFKSAATM